MPPFRRRNGGYMRVNKEELARLAEKSDEELWREIRKLAKGHGFTLPEATPSRENIEKIRRAMLGVEKISLSDAAKIINSYKKGK